MLIQPDAKEIRTLLNIWERSVRQSHYFLSDSDIAFYRPFIEKFLSQLEVYVIRQSGRIVAFMALGDNSIEMLFVTPSKFKAGYGSQLIDIAIYERGIGKVDVNEQNTNALDFYKKKGFVVVERDNYDAFGKPYPILHLELEKAECLETPRLLLRPFSESDLSDFYAICSSPEVSAFGGWKAHASIEESRTILRDVFANHKTVWAIERRSDNKLIGAIGLTTDHRRSYPEARNLGYWLGKSYWSNGYMKEAVAEVISYVKASKIAEIITASCFTDNPRSRSVLLHAGFREEGTLHCSYKSHKAIIKDEYLFFLPIRQ